MVEKGFANLHGSIRLFLAKTKCSAFFKLKPPDSTLSVSLGGSACLHKPPLLRYAHPFLFNHTTVSHRHQQNKAPGGPIISAFSSAASISISADLWMGPEPQAVYDALCLCVLACARAARRADACHRAPFRQSDDESSPEGVCPPEGPIINMTARGKGTVKSEAVEEKS